MDKREALKSMLNNLINDKPEQAAMDFHNYLAPKMREIAGVGGAPSQADVDDDTDVQDNE
jgi:hypothetical protein